MGFRSCRIKVFFLLCMLVGCFILPANALEPPSKETIVPMSSDYFVKNSISILPGGSGRVKISLFVQAKSIMSEIGATKVVVYEKQAEGNYNAVYTYTRENCPSIIQKNRSSVQINISYPGTTGKEYFVTAACYAKNSFGSQSSWVSSPVIEA